MEDTNKYILVLGSKPDSFIPNLNYSHIYAANGAAEKTVDLKKNSETIEFTSIVGGLEFLKNLKVQKRVIESNPDNLISRVNEIDINKYNFSKQPNYEFFSNFNQLMFQSNFFKFGFLDIISKEMNYENKLLYKLKHLFKCIKSGIGASTGFFAILYALNKHPEHNIIISGIGMSGGGQYYDINSDRYTKRAMVDKKLILNLKKKYKDRLFTTDENLSYYGKLKIWNL